MTLRELATRLGVESYPEKFERIYDELQGDNTAFFNKSEFDAIEAEYGIFGDYYDVILDGAESLKNNTELSLWISVMCEYFKTATFEEASVIKLPDVRSEGSDVMCVFPYLVRASQMAEAYRAHGFSEEEIREVFGLFRRMMDLTRMSTGKLGYSSRYFNWTRLYSYCKIFDLGSFNFEFRNMPFHAMLLRNKESGEFKVIMTAGRFNSAGLVFDPDGDSEEGSFNADFSETETEIFGHEAVGGYVLPNLSAFRKDEWECIVKRLDEVISLHIPRNADLSPEAIDRSLDMGIKFAKERFPEYSPKLIFCSSWLLDPQLSELLGENSKICGFASRFMRYPYTPRKGKGGFEFIFPGCSMDKVEELPENTSLQRKLKEFYMNGGNMVFVPGFITDKLF